MDASPLSIQSLYCIEMGSVDTKSGQVGFLLHYNDNKAVEDCKLALSLSSCICIWTHSNCVLFVPSPFLREREEGSGDKRSLSVADWNAIMLHLYGICHVTGNC